MRDLLSTVAIGILFGISFFVAKENPNIIQFAFTGGTFAIVIHSAIFSALRKSQKRSQGLKNKQEFES